MTAETAHHPSGPLVLACSLAGVAGFVDAHLFLHITNVFVANMSGNMVRVGIFSGSGDWSIAAGSVAALFAFGAGVMVAMVAMVAMTGDSNRPGRYGPTNSS